MNTFTIPPLAGLRARRDRIVGLHFSIDTFIISLKNEAIIRFVTAEPDNFKQWLEHHGVRNVNETLGKMEYNYYFPKGDENSKFKSQKSSTARVFTHPPSAQGSRSPLPGGEEVVQREYTSSALCSQGTSFKGGI